MGTWRNKIWASLLAGLLAFGSVVALRPAHHGRPAASIDVTTGALAQASGPTQIVVTRFSRTVPGTPFRILVLGDSITAFGWYSFFAQWAEQAQLSATGPPPQGQLPFASVANPTATHVWFNSGVAGNSCIDILTATVAARVTAYLPDLVIFGPMGVNDLVELQANGHPTDAECTTNHALIYSQIKSQNPLAQIFVSGALALFENWPQGVNANDAGLDLKDGVVTSTATSAGIVNKSTRADMFAYEAIHNPSHLNLGILLTDDRHPNDTGRQFLSTEYQPFFVFQ